MLWRDEGCNDDVIFYYCLAISHSHCSSADDEYYDYGGTQTQLMETQTLAVNPKL